MRLAGAWSGPVTRALYRYQHLPPLSLWTNPPRRFPALARRQSPPRIVYP